MNRSIINFLSFLLGFSAIAYVEFAHAENQIYQYSYNLDGQYPVCPATDWNSDPVVVATAVVTCRNLRYPDSATYGVAVYYSWESVQLGVDSMINGSGPFFTGRMLGRWWCVQANEASVGGSCPVNICADKTGSVPGVTGGWYSGTAAGGNPGATLCVGGCQYSRGTFGANTTTGEFSARAGQGTGQACTSQPVGTPVDLSTAAPETPSSCLAKNKSFGTVNGQTVCVTAGTAGAAPVKFETAPKTTTTENKDSAGNPVAGGGTTTTEKTASTNGDGTVTIGTKTTNPDGTSTTQTDVQDQSQFCQSNPTSPLCEQAKTDCDKNPNALGCMDAGEAADTETLGTKNVPVSVTPVSVGADNGTCPAPRVIHIPVVGSSVNFSFDKVCEFMTMIRPVVLALAWLGAGLITVGGFRNG